MMVAGTLKCLSQLQHIHPEPTEEQFDMCLSAGCVKMDDNRCKCQLSALCLDFSTDCISF